MAEDAATERRTDAVDRVRDRAAELAPAFGSTWTDDEPWRFLTDLTAIGSRMAGSEGEARGADLVADAFERAGLADVRTEPFDLPAWERGSASLDVTVSGRDGEPTTRSFEALALPYSPGGSVSGELVDVGYGTPAEIDERDVEGRIAVASTTTPEGGRFVHRMEKFGYAIDAGAVGFVFVNHLDGQLPPTGSLTFGEEAEAVAVGVSKETGAWLREYAVGGGGAGPSGSGAVAQAELSVEASTTPGESRNVIGRAGPDTDERVLLLAHYDAHDIAEGALDNGCGIATVVTAAGIPVNSPFPMNTIKVHFLGNILNRGHKAVGGTCSGRVVKAPTVEEAKTVLKNTGDEILLTHNLEPEHVPFLESLIGVIVEEESYVSPEEVQANNPDIVLISEVPDAIEKLEDNQFVSLDGGEKIVYEGLL